MEDPAGIVKYPLGGMGYQIMLPDIRVQTLTGNNAVIVFPAAGISGHEVWQQGDLPGLVGNDAHFNVSTTDYGQITEITLTNPGLNFVAKPNVSLRIMDLLLQFNGGEEPIQGDLIYQGDFDAPTYFSYVDSVSEYASTTKMVRTYNYDGQIELNDPIKLARGLNTININITVDQITNEGEKYYSGKKTYGNGIARASAKFTNGITLGPGVYADEDGQPSGYSIFEDMDYNDYTYLLQVETALETYKNSVLEFLHPSGLNYNTFNMLKNEEAYDHTAVSEDLTVSSLAKLINNKRFVANISAEANTIQFSNLNGADIGNTLDSLNGDDLFITIYPKNGGPSFHSKIVSANSNTIVMEDNWNVIVPNVANAHVTAGSDSINIIKLTDSWNIATGNIVNYFSDFMNQRDSVSFDGVNFKEIINVDQLINIPSADIFIPPTNIKVISSFANTETGYITLKQNVITSNVWISSINPIN
jgi:hypothetical protein